MTSLRTMGLRAIRSQAPALLLHCLLVPVRVRLVEGIRLVVLFVDVASVEGAIHALALEATVVLLLLHAAADVLLLARARADDPLVVGLRAWVPILARALLVRVGQCLVTAGAWVLLLHHGDLEIRRSERHKRHQSGAD